MKTLYWMSECTSKLSNLSSHCSKPRKRKCFMTYGWKNFQQLWVKEGSTCYGWWKLIRIIDNFEGKIHVMVACKDKSK